MTNTIIRLFIPDIIVNMDENTLCYKPFDRKKCFKGGDLGRKTVYKSFMISLNFDSNCCDNLSQEDKNRVDIPNIIAIVVGSCLCPKYQ